MQDIHSHFELFVIIFPLELVPIPRNLFTVSVSCMAVQVCCTAVMCESVNSLLFMGHYLTSSVQCVAILSLVTELLILWALVI